MKTKDILEKLVYHMQRLKPEEYKILSSLKGASDADISSLEETLAVSFPEDFRAGLKFYGATVLLDGAMELFERPVISPELSDDEDEDDYEDDDFDDDYKHSYLLALPHYAEMRLLNIRKITAAYQALMESGLAGKPHDNDIDGLENVVWHEKWIPIASNCGDYDCSNALLSRFNMLVLDEKSPYFGKVVDWLKSLDGPFQYDMDDYSIGSKHITTYHHYLEDFYLKFHHNGMMYEDGCYFIEDTSVSYIKKARVRRMLLDAIPTIRKLKESHLYCNLDHLAGLSDDRISALESKLNVSFPETYQEALSVYGRTVYEHRTYCKKTYETTKTYHKDHRPIKKTARENTVSSVYMVDYKLFGHEGLMTEQQILQVYQLLCDSEYNGLPRENDIGLPNVAWHPTWVPIVTEDNERLHERLDTRYLLLVCDKQSPLYGSVIYWFANNQVGLRAPSFDAFVTRFYDDLNSPLAHNTKYGLCWDVQEDDDE